MHKNTYNHQRSPLFSCQQGRKILCGILITLIIFPQVEASTWRPTALVNTEAFQVIDDVDSGSNVVLKFGDILGKTLTYNRSTSRFEFNASTYTQGNVSASGYLSGANIFGLGLTTCSNGTTSKLLYDSGTGKFSCGTDQTGGGGSAPEVGTSSFTGGVLRLGDQRWVKKEGDTMTGSLVLSITKTNTASGALVIDQRTNQTGAYVATRSNQAPALVLDAVGTSIAPHLLFGYRGTFDTNLFRQAAHTLRTDDSLFVQNTLSGAHVKADRLLTSSGELVVEGRSTHNGVTVFNEDSTSTSNVRMESDNQVNMFFLDAANDRIGLGTSTPSTTLDVAGVLKRKDDIFSSTSYSVPTATAVAITLPTGGTTLTSGYAYRFRLITQFTGTKTGANYIIYESSTGVWTSRLVSANGITSNHPLLQITGTTVEIFHNHASTYNISVVGESIYHGNTTNIGATLFGLDGAMTNILGQIGVGTTTPKADLDVQGTLSGSALRIQGSGTATFDGNLTFGNAISDAITVNAGTWNFANNTSFIMNGGAGTLEVVGTLSGSALTVSGLRNCDTIDTNANGVLSCGTDASGGGGGFSQTIADERYVKKAGDTMTGSLSVRGTLSGFIVHASSELRSSGSLIVKGDARIDDTFYLNSTTNRLGIGSGLSAPKTTLEVNGTISGSQLRASNMRLSGSVVYSSGNTLLQTAKGLSGQLLISQDTNAPKWASPVGGMVWAFDGIQTIGTAIGAKIVMPMSIVVSSVSMIIKGAPTGAALIVDLKKDGISIFSTKPQIDAAATTGGSSAVFSTTALSENSVLTLDINQVGSTFAGSGLTVMLKGTRKY